MTALADHGCDRAGCARDAAALVEPDDGSRVLLCGPCHAEAERGAALRLHDGRLLLAVELAEWMILPAGVRGDGRGR